MFLLKNTLDENQIFPVVCSEMFSELCYFHLKVSQNWFLKKIFKEESSKLAFFSNGRHKSIKFKESE